MLAASILAKKRDALELSEAEIRYLVDGFVNGSVADYQMSALAMAIVLRGMTAQETASLTLAMLDSGERLSRLGNVQRLDKHSTGGLGDKVSLILAPLLACHGVCVPMISGRGLGLSGGTLDKLESIPGFQCQLAPAERERQLQQIGCFIIGADDRIAPADRRLYALRDVTATVESIPLITASILSKKLAASLDHLVMDVKVGSAAFMKTRQQATALAQSIVQTGAMAGLPTTAVLTDMDQPLGHAVGNAIEINEVLLCLQGDGPVEVNQLTVHLAAQVLVDADQYATMAQASEALWQTIHSGLARQRFDQLISAQGGKLLGPLPLAPASHLLAEKTGFVEAIDCETIGRCVVEMGGGRQRSSDSIDPTVGLHLHVRIGDSVEKGQPLISFYAHADTERWRQTLAGVVSLAEHAIASRTLIIDTIDQSFVAPTSAPVPT